MKKVDTTELDARPSSRHRNGDRSQVAPTAPRLDGSPPDRTSPHHLDQYIAGRTLASGDSPAWVDLFVQVHSRNDNQEPFLVPAVAEPLIV